MALAGQIMTSMSVRPVPRSAHNCEVESLNSELEVKVS